MRWETTLRRAAAKDLGLRLHDPPRQPLSMSASFAERKRRMGPPSDEGAWMHGARPGPGGRDTEVLAFAERGRGSEARLVLHAIARITPALFLGLGVSRRPWRSAARRAGGHAVALSDPALSRGSRRVHVCAADPARAASLLEGRGGPQRALAARLHALEDDFVVGDGAVHLTRHCRAPLGPRGLASALDGMLRVAVDLAAAFVEQSAWLPADLVRAGWVGAWEADARREGLTFDEVGLEVSGDVSGARVVVLADGVPGARAGALTVTFAPELGLGLRLRRQRAPQVLMPLLGGQDIVIGDRPFDGRFVIEGREPDGVRRALAEPDVRAAILAIDARATDFRFDDRGLAAGFGATGSDGELRFLIDDVRAIVEGLRSARLETGPYR